MGQEKNGGGLEKVEQSGRSGNNGYGCGGTRGLELLMNYILTRRIVICDDSSEGEFDRDSVGN